MRLRQKLLFIIVPLILLPIILAGGITYIYSQNTKVHLENANLHSDVMHGVNEINHLTNNIATAIRYLSHNHLLKQAIVRGDQQSLDAAESALAEFATVFSDTASLKLLANDGSVVASYFKGARSFSELSIENYQKMTWGMFSSNQGEMPLVQVSWPLYQVSESASSQVLGLLHLVLEPDLINHLKLDSGLGDKLLITDMQGNIVFSFPEKQVGGQIPDYLFSRLLGSVETKAAIDVELGGEEIYMTGQRLSNKYLFLFGQSRSHYQQQEVTLSWLLPIVISASVLLAAVLIIISVNRLIIEPISRLSGAKQEVAQGNLDIKLQVHSKDEIAELFSSFNVMVKQLEVYREKEKDSRLRLEYKVTERTEDLESANKELEAANLQLEQAKQLSEQANQLKTAFVANMSHEIRTPLTAILGFTEQVIADSPRTPHQLDLLGRVLRSGKHLLSLINNILDLSKIEAGKIELEVKRFDMFELFNDVVSIMSNQAAEKQLDFEFNYHYPLPRYIRSDTTRLRQVLLNLASNAIKFTEKGSVKIDVAFLADGQQVEVKVADTGIGISKQVLEYIFEPFTQADISISRRFGGTGLGLVISRSFAKLLGGDITAKSKLAEGSEFIFTFSLAVDEEQFDCKFANSMMDLVHSDEPGLSFKSEAKQEQKDETEFAQCCGRVLVAEDVEDNQYLFKLLLKSLGVDFVMVSNGEEAVEKALTEDFDLILMDMQMPVMGGLEATELLRGAGLEMPIYALTANVMKEDMAQHIAAGCNGTIAKPVNREKFKRVVSSVLPKKGSEQKSQDVMPDQVMKKLQKKYVGQLPEQVQVLNNSLVNKDLTSLVGELHKIKGSAGSYGFSLLSTMSAELEAKYKHQAASDLEWQKLGSELEVLIQTIGNICHAENSERLS